jgi:hypothetical protein
VTVALLLTAACRPHVALLAFGLLVPLGSLLPGWIGAAPDRYVDVVVLATLSGAFIAAARKPLSALRPQAPSLAPPAVALVCIAGCSAALSLVSASANRLVGAADAAVVLKGLALALMVARHARDGVARPVQLLQSMAAAGAASALLVFVWARPFAPGAAGPYFAMTVCVGLALVFHHIGAECQGQRRWVPGVAALAVAGLVVGGAHSLDQRFSPSRSVSHAIGLDTRSALTVLGVLVLVWLLATGARRIARGLRASPSDLLLMGAAVALIVFVTARTMSVPLLTPEAAYPFWMLCGIAVARADGDAQLPDGSPLIGA